MSRAIPSLSPKIAQGTPKRGLIVRVAVIGSLLLTTSSGLSSSRIGCEHPLDVPIDIAAGTVRIQPFETRHRDYQIWFRAKRRFSTDQMNCELGLYMFPEDKCKEQPLLAVDWTVSDEDGIVAQGRINNRSRDGNYAEDYVERFLGDFKGENKKHYILELRFAKSAAALQEMDPHIVVEEGESFWCASM